MSTADELTDKLGPLVSDGNHHAVLALCRLITADDPEAEATAIIQEMAEQVNRIVAIMAPAAEAYTAWVEDGVANAEDAANGDDSLSP